MKLKLIREVFTSTETIGSLFIDDVFYCYTLEDADRGLKKSMSLKTIQKTKIYAATAIPYGIYEVSVTMSPRFKRIMPEVLGVPGFAGIRIHGGNTHLNSEGCILVAKSRFLDKPNPTIAKIKNWILGSMEKDLTQKLVGKSIELEIVKKDG
jgi:hypothetical protein